MSAATTSDSCDVAQLATGVADGRTCEASGAGRPLDGRQNLPLHVPVPPPVEISMIVNGSLTAAITTAVRVASGDVRGSLRSR